jgi:class 3 adenylate cyclase
MDGKLTRYLESLERATRDILRLKKAEDVPPFVVERMSAVMGTPLRYAFVDRYRVRLYESEHVDEGMRDLLQLFLEEDFIVEMEKLDWNVIDSRGVRFLLKEGLKRDLDVDFDILIVPKRVDDRIDGFSVLWGDATIARAVKEDIDFISAMSRAAESAIALLSSDSGSGGSQRELKRKTLELKEIAGLGVDLTSLGKEDFFGSLLLNVMGRALCRTAVIFLSTNENNTAYAPVASRGVLKKFVENIRVTDKTSYIREMGTTKKPLVIGEFVSNLDSDERQELLRLEAVVLIPLLSKSGVIGFLALGDRLNKKPFTDKVFDSIGALCNQMVMAIENSKLSSLRYAFSRYVSHQIADEILSAPDEIKLGGERRKVTCLFADIRGFTTMAEKMAPEEVVDLLNTYLSGLTDVVFKYEGTLDKYIGDCLMAVFGAPISHYNDSERATIAAIDMLKLVDAINRERENEGKQKVEIGIGINMGYVISGNMGSVDKMDYTVIGDVVNTAARLEAMAGPSQILISREVYDEVRYVVDAEFLDTVNVKGREQAVDVYVVKDLMAGKYISVLSRVEPYKVGHYLNIARDAELIGQELGFSPDDLIRMRSAIMLIDIGRIGLSEGVFNKREKLTDDELGIVKSHVLRGAEYVTVKLNLFKEGVDLVRHHHEFWDGSGYPDGLRGEEIPLWARIVGMVDAYHAMISKRPFREPMKEEEAMQVLEKNKGIKYDPGLVDIYLKVLRERIEEHALKV